MSLSTLFSVLNFSVVPAWALLIGFPRARVTRSLIHAVYIPALLAIAYALILFSDRPGPQGAHFFSLDGVMRIFTSPQTVIACWVHYLVFDLFIGAWEVREAQRRGIPHGWVVPCLVLTLAFGPVGLCAFLLVRFARTRAVSLEETAVS